MVDAYLGEIRLFAGNWVPQQFVACDGSLLPINQNQALFAVLGVVFGGDGVATFGVPDLRGRVPLHKGQGTGLTPRVLGQAVGAETVTVAAAQMPAHNHTLFACSDPATVNSPINALPATAPAGYTQFVTNQPGQTLTKLQLAEAAVSPVGSGDAHANVMPSLALTFILCSQGIFPVHP
ncbi:phage tail protein [Rhodospirillum rubrum]|uniref:phage tail protein n=1 Tax=Rhodospirillum rubrum TaxID=1085 RepID=UPI001906CA9B|nr:tail fiber protein [Rhodospirillum rubrum]MBK1665245.1 phage tail protein [Rhodospirillum rubrum]MBK1678164.1 phage tail protein [Rhodospirillum rubrum]